MKQLLFSLKEGSVSYHKKEILKELDINIHRKDFIALVGKNGAGKSTVMNVISGQHDIDAGEKWAGSTVHFATEELDAGPMIIQGRVPIKPEDTAKRLAARVLKIEHQIYPEALSLLSMERLKYEDGAAYLDGKLLLKPIQYS